MGEELARRFDLPYWQFALTATDANRFAIRLAREITGRPKVLVFNWCYHGTVDETFVTLRDGHVVARRGNLGPPVPLDVTTRVVEFNDVEALERELAHGDVACVLTEPALTNVGIVHPDPGFHDALRELTRRTETLLIVDETHTICCGPGGFTAANGLEPDLLTIGKPIAGGVPAAAYGFSADDRAARGRPHRARGRRRRRGGRDACGQRALARRDARDAPARADRRGVRGDDPARGPVHGGRRGGDRAATACPGTSPSSAAAPSTSSAPTGRRNGAEAAVAGDFELERLMHLYALNRGVLLTPFHNMALMSPATTQADVDRHTEVFGEAVAELTAEGTSGGT